LISIYLEYSYCILVTLHYHYFCYFQNSQERNRGVCSSVPVIILLIEEIWETFFTQNSTSTSNATTGGSRSDSLNSTRIMILEDLHTKAGTKSDLNGTYHPLCSTPVYISETAKYISWFVSIVFLVTIAIGNILILLLTRLNKSLDSPMFVTIQSLSAISVMRAGFVLYYRFATRKWAWPADLEYWSLVVAMDYNDNTDSTDVISTINQVCTYVLYS